jgi:hypothetical protein
MIPSVLAHNHRGPRRMEHVLAAVRQANPRRLPMEFTFTCHQENVTLLVRCPPARAAAAVSQLAAHYPTAAMSRLADDALAAPPGAATWPTELRPVPALFRIRCCRQCDGTLNSNAADPLTGILAVIAPDQQSSHHRLSRLYRPARTGRWVPTRVIFRHSVCSPVRRAAVETLPPAALPIRRTGRAARRRTVRIGRRITSANSSYSSRSA